MGAYRQIAALLGEAIGLDADSTGLASLEHQVNLRMQAVDVRDCAAYLDRLRRDPEETDRLIEDVVVPETWFFRDVEPFAFLARHVRDCWRPSHAGGVLKVLSAPCATGEEPYSIAIALLEAGLGPGEFRVLGVDISRRGLETARQARYGKRSFRGAWPFSERERYFQEEDGLSRLSREVASLVEFERTNLVEPGFLVGRGPYDVIFCRNVLIYLTDAARRTTLAALDRLLSPDGVLVSGHSEMPLMLRSGYEAVRHPRSFACRRASGKPVRRRTGLPACPSGLGDPAPPSPAHTPTLLEQARALADRGEMEGAEALCERALRHNGAEAEGHYLKGLIRASAGGLEAAEESLRRALYLRPDHYEALVQMSVLCERKGEAERSAVFRARARRLTEAPGRDG